MRERIRSIATAWPTRLLVSLALLGAVALSVDWDIVADRLSNASWGWFALSVVLLFFAFMVGAVRWHALLEASSLRVSWRDTLRAYMIGAFTNNLLPTGYGGDAVRAWIVGRSGKPLARALTSVAVDRITALGCLVGLTAVVIGVGATTVPDNLRALLAVGVGVGVIAVSTILLTVRRRGLGRFLPATLRPWAKEVADALRAYGSNRSLFGQLLVLGIIYQCLVMVSLSLVAKSVGVSIGPGTFAVIAPAVLVATVLPISIAGFGVREASYVVLLGEFGVDASDAALISLLSIAAVVIASAPGGLAILLRREDQEALASSRLSRA